MHYIFVVYFILSRLLFLTFPANLGQMHATSKHETPSLTSLPKDGGMSCFARSSGRWPIQLLTVHNPCLTSVKLMDLARPLGHSPRESITLAIVVSWPLRLLGSFRQALRYSSTLMIVPSLICMFTFNLYPLI